MSRSDVASIFRFRLLLARVLFSPAYRSRGWWHMYTHTNRTHALTFDLEFERNTVKPRRRSSREFPRTRWKRGFRLLFSFLALTHTHAHTSALTLNLSFSLLHCVLRAVAVRKSSFFRNGFEDPWKPFAAGTVKRQTVISDKSCWNALFLQVIPVPRLVIEQTGCLSRAKSKSFERLIPRNFLTDVEGRFWSDFDGFTTENALRTSNLKCYRNTRGETSENELYQHSDRSVEKGSEVKKWNGRRDRLLVERVDYWPRQRRLSRNLPSACWHAFPVPAGGFEGEKKKKKKNCRTVCMTSGEPMKRACTFYQRATNIFPSNESIEPHRSFPSPLPFFIRGTIRHRHNCKKPRILRGISRCHENCRDVLSRVGKLRCTRVKSSLPDNWERMFQSYAYFDSY